MKISTLVADRKRLAAQFFTIALFCLIAILVQAQNKVSAIAVSISQSAVVAYGTSSSALYDVTVLPFLREIFYLRCNGLK